jgi:hypothetical protein
MQHFCCQSIASWYATAYKKLRTYRHTCKMWYTQQAMCCSNIFLLFLLTYALGNARDINFIMLLFYIPISAHDSPFHGILTYYCCCTVLKHKKKNKNFAVAKKTPTDGQKFSNARPTELIIYTFQ